MAIYYIKGSIQYRAKCSCEFCIGHQEVQEVLAGLRAVDARDAANKCLEEYKDFLNYDDAYWAEPPEVGIVPWSI